MAKLKEVCTFYSGTGFPTKYQGNDEGEYAFYKVSDIANNVQLGNTYLSVCNNYISGEIAKEIKGCILPKDTVVFAKIGEAVKLNRRAITSADCLIDNNAMGLAPIQDKLRLDYFFYYMRNLKMEKLAESTTVPSVRKSLLEELEIKVPSLEEQKEIGEILDKVSVVIQTRKQEIEQKNIFKCVYEIANPFDHHTHFDYKFVEDNKDKLSQVYEQLADEYSKECFVAFINSRIWEDSGYVRDIFRGEIDEFNNDVMRLESTENFLDIGAYDGGSIKRFLKSSNGKYQSIIGIEPESRNFSKLERFCDINKIHAKLYQIGCWNKKDRLYFNDADVNVAQKSSRVKAYISLLRRPTVHETAASNVLYTMKTSTIFWHKDEKCPSGRLRMLSIIVYSQSPNRSILTKIERQM